MGAMHCWVWGEMYPGFRRRPGAAGQRADADRRAQSRDAEDDHGQHHRTIPPGRHGDYTEQPREGLIGAINLLMMMTSSPLQWHKAGADARRGRHMVRGSDPHARWRRPTRTTCCISSTRRATTIRRRTSRRSPRPCSPSTRPTTSVNPPELGLMEKLMPRVKHGTLRPDSDERPDARPRHALAAGDLGHITSLTFSTSSARRSEW